MKDNYELIEGIIGKHPQIDLPLKHHFSEGVYVREIFMPKDTVVLGHKHLTKHLNIISQGVCVLKDIETGELSKITAPCTFESDVGVRKLLYIVEDCVWSTVHVTEETSVDKLEDMLIEKSNTYLELEKKKELLCHSQP